MKLQLFFIFILMASLLLPACSTRESYVKDQDVECVTIKHNIPSHLTLEIIEVELALDRKVEVNTKLSTTPIKVTSIENDILLGATSDGQEVKIAIEDVTEAWSLITVEKGAHEYKEIDTHHLDPYPPSTLQRYIGGLAALLGFLVIVSFF